MLVINNDFFPNWQDIPVNEMPAVIINGRNIDRILSSYIYGWDEGTNQNQKITTESKIIQLMSSVQSITANNFESYFFALMNYPIMKYCFFGSNSTLFF